MNEADHELLAGIFAGEPRAQRRFVALFHRPIRQTIAATWAQRGARLSEADLDDAQQQVFLALFSREAHILRQWKGESSLRGYLRGVARRMAMRLLSRIARDGGRFRLILDAPVGGVESEDRPALIDAIPEADAGLSAEAWLQIQQEREHLRGAILGQLTEQGRALYQWLYVEELDVAQVAEKAQMNPNSIYQWRNRIRRVAQRILQEAGYALLALLTLAPTHLALLPPSDSPRFMEKLNHPHKNAAPDPHLNAMGPICDPQTPREPR